MNTKRPGAMDLRTGTDDPQVKNPVPPGEDGPGMPRAGRYEHTQRGFLLIVGVSAAIILILAINWMVGMEWVSVMVLCLMVFLLSIMSTLTASVGNGTLAIRFGPIGLIRKSWPVSGIVSATTVTNHWIYGWGIRWTPRGRLYNISGSRGVEVLMFSGERFRIGTDEPEALRTAIETARAAMKNP